MQIIEKKGILIIGKDPLDGFNGAKIIAEAEYCINFHDQQNELLRFNNSFLFVNGMKINQYTAKDFEIYKNAMCLGNISKDFTKKTKINIEKKKLDHISKCMVFQLIIIVLMLIIF